MWRPIGKRLLFKTFDVKVQIQNVPELWRQIFWKALLFPNGTSHMYVSARRKRQISRQYQSSSIFWTFNILKYWRRYKSMNYSSWQNNMSKLSKITLKQCPFGWLLLYWFWTRVFFDIWYNRIRSRLLIMLWSISYLTKLIVFCS